MFFWGVSPIEIFDNLLFSIPTPFCLSVFLLLLLQSRFPSTLVCFISNYKNYPNKKRSRCCEKFTEWWRESWTEDVTLNDRYIRKSHLSQKLTCEYKRIKHYTPFLNKKYWIKFVGAISLSLVIALEVLSWKSTNIMMWSCKLSPTGKSATTGIYKIENKFI